MQKIVTFLWFNNNAEEAVKFYTSIFKKSKISKVLRCGEAGPGPKGSVLGILFKLEGQEFYALNGGPQHKFNPAISLFVNCKTQKEVDVLWKKLSAGGKEVACGWLEDKFGVSWQIIPEKLMSLLHSKDEKKAGRVMKAMMEMVKIDVAELERAAKGK